ncbi:MAG: hypothetical protein ACLFUQ_07315 [Candidatus Izemoplasmataceae bacterium]
MPDIDFPVPNIEIPYPVEVLIGAFLLAFGGILTLLWLHRRMKQRKLVRKLEKRRPKAYYADAVLTFTKKHRKTGSNTYRKLRPKGRKRFDRYLGFKRRELNTVLKYLDKKAFGKPKSKLSLRLLEGKREVGRIKWPWSLKALTRAIDKYDCLDECILYLDMLPRKVADKKVFRYSPKSRPITFDYELE